jgi:fluoride ion exporter CrcB/FEX
VTGPELLLVAAAGGVGALVRHELTSGRHLLALHVVNVAGSLALGFVLGLGGAGPMALLAASSGLGGMTSFSTWMVGARAEARRARAPGPVLLLHVLAPMLLAVLAAGVGVALAGAAGGTAATP